MSTVASFEVKGATIHELEGAAEQYLKALITDDGINVYRYRLSGIRPSFFPASGAVPTLWRADVDAEIFRKETPS